MNTGLSPFKTLFGLAQRVVDSAAPMPDRSASADTWQAIAFEFMNSTFVVPMRDVTEVLPVPNVTRLPGVQKWVRGIANVRGEILALVDLNDFVGAGRVTNPVLSRVVAIQIGDMGFGVVVDRVIGMRQVNQANIQSGAAETCPTEMKEYVSGAVQLDDQDVHLFDPLKLVKSDTFVNVSTL